ncbi:MAG: hypothetical protein AAGJ68_08435 [Pseudomonadota bacterium]
MRWLIALLVLTAPSAAADEEAHHIAFSEGRYSEAASVANQTQTPDNLAFAARSLLAEAISTPDFIPSPVLLDQAQLLAEEALAEAPHHIEARLQLAIALSLKTRPMSMRAIRKSGYGDRAKDLVDSVLVDEPSNTYAHGFLSVWHIEVRRRGGAIGASIMGASVKHARQHYQAAVKLDPDDASVHWQYARALTSLNAKKYREDIDQALAKAALCSSNSALEDVMKSRAAKLQAALGTKTRKEIEALASEML